jgi:Fe-S-cluster containining protein
MHITMTDDRYRDILERADRHFSDVFREQRASMQCGIGCSLCCHGLFEIGAADIPVLAEGLEALHPSRRRRIIRRAAEILTASEPPNLRECSPEEKEAFFERTDSVPCPNLDDYGRCMVYDHRPLVCRTFGLPIRDGERYIGDVCELNFEDASERDLMRAAWDLQWEDILGPEDEYTIPEAIMLVARMRGWAP